MLCNLHAVTSISGTVFTLCSAHDLKLAESYLFSVSKILDFYSVKRLTNYKYFHVYDGLFEIRPVI